ncbi:hypothetical protein [Kitasatospora sp. NPDC088779]|uniref:hypothetical protein n=1 Tax=unclassified Kitasatospora TaxID=2633591 RepID=UPI003427FC26
MWRSPRWAAEDRNGTKAEELGTALLAVNPGVAEDRNRVTSVPVNPATWWRALFGAAEDRNWYSAIDMLWISWGGGRPQGAAEDCNIVILRKGDVPRQVAVALRGRPWIATAPKPKSWVRLCWRSSSGAAEDRNTLTGLS